MARVEGEITIHRSVEDVFDFVADQSHEPLYNPDMVSSVKETPGPIGRGTCFRSAVRSGRRVAEMRIEVTGYESPRLLTSTTTMSQLDIDYTLRFEGSGDGGTRMRWSGNVRPKGALRLLGPLVSVMGNRQERRIWSQLKSYLEGTAGR
ncbi:SRPBCC family protein [Knoellia locipacati]|uniref:SRPBCC family protein n=1 Tax=Knoellia locipacati TaxID=882824 RepID=UPI00384EB8E3